MGCLGGMAEVKSQTGQRAALLAVLTIGYTQQVCQKFHRVSKSDRMTMTEYTEAFYDLVSRSAGCTRPMRY